MSITTRLLKRAPIAGALLGTGVALSSAVHVTAAQEDQPRSVLTIGVDACPGSADGGAISVGYDDLVDGHQPQQVTERLADESGELWSTNEVHHVNGDYFNVHNFPATAAIPITSESVFTYSLTITYDDGVTQTQSVGLAIADDCAAGAPVTTAPPSTAPGAARFGLTSDGATCLPAAGTEAYAELWLRDAVDGRVPVEHHLQLLDGGSIVYDQSGAHGSPGVDGEHGGWFLPGDLGVDRLEATTYTLVVWVKYDDGVVASDRVSHAVRASCAAAAEPATTQPPSPSTTTPPSGQLPQTGGSTTWSVVGLGAALSAAGVALVLGSRRRRMAA